MISHKERYAMRPYYDSNTNDSSMTGTQLQPRFSSEIDSSSKRRFRTNFTESQSLILEEAFQDSHYPDQNAKRAMSVLLDIPEDRITVWFQNRRAKWRRKEVRERERKTTDYGLSNSASSTASQPCVPQPRLEPYSQTANTPSSFQPPTSSHMQPAYTHFDNDFSHQFHEQSSRVSKRSFFRKQSLR